MEWNDDKIMEFLDLYETEPIIWNPRSKYHKDRSQVYEAWKRIHDNLSHKCSLAELKKKKAHLMSTYRKLTNKVKYGKKIGELYTPEWFAYERMASFLDAVYTPRRHKYAEIMENEIIAMEEDLPDNDIETPDPIESSSVNTANQDEENSDSPAVNQDGPPVNQDGPPVSKKRRVEQLTQSIQIEKRMDEAYLYLKQVAAKPKVVKDESYIFCELLCCKLRLLDYDIQASAMHEINNIMRYFKKPQQNYQHPYYQQPVSCISPAQTSLTSSTHQHGPKDNQRKRIREKFAVISFPDEDDTVYIVARSWLKKTEANDFHICSWPSYKGDARIKEAVLENETPSSTWSKCNARLIKLCSTYESAEEILKVIDIISTRKSEILFQKKCKQFQNKPNSLLSPIYLNSSPDIYNPLRAMSQSGPFICEVTANADESFNHNCSSTTSVENDKRNSLSTQTKSFVGDAAKLREVQILNEASEICGNSLMIKS